MVYIQTLVMLMALCASCEARSPLFYACIHIVLVQHLVYLTSTGTCPLTWPSPTVVHVSLWEQLPISGELTSEVCNIVTFEPYIDVCNCNITLSAVNMYKKNNEQLPNVYECFIVLVWLLIYVHTLVDLYPLFWWQTQMHTLMHMHTQPHIHAHATHKHVRIFKHTHTNMHVYAHKTTTHTHMCTHTTMCIQDGLFPLYVASQEGHDRSVEILLQAGATADLQDKVEKIAYLFICHL